MQKIPPSKNPLKFENRFICAETVPRRHRRRKKILEEAKDWLTAKQAVILATVIQTWGSSPRPIGSRMIVNEKGDFSGSVSGGCVETAVVRECLSLLKDKKPFKKIEFKVSNESAWEIGLACGGEIAIFLEQIN